MHLAIGKIFDDTRVKGYRFLLSAKRLVNVGGRIAGSFDVRTGRITLHNLPEIIERLRIVVAIPQDLADLEERFGGLRACRIVPSNLFEQRNRFVSLAKREIEIGDCWQYPATQSRLGTVAQKLLVEKLRFTVFSFPR